MDEEMSSLLVDAIKSHTDGTDESVISALLNLAIVIESHEGMMCELMGNLVCKISLLDKSLREGFSLQQRNEEG